MTRRAPGPTAAPPLLLILLLGLRLLLAARAAPLAYAPEGPDEPPWLRVWAGWRLAEAPDRSVAPLPPGADPAGPAAAAAGSEEACARALEASLAAPLAVWDSVSGRCELWGPGTGSPGVYPWRLVPSRASLAPSEAHRLIAKHADPLLPGTPTIVPPSTAARDAAFPCAEGGALGCFALPSDPLAWVGTVAPVPEYRAADACRQLAYLQDARFYGTAAPSNGTALCVVAGPETALLLAAGRMPPASAGGSAAACAGPSDFFFRDRLAPLDACGRCAPGADAPTAPCPLADARALAAATKKGDRYVRLGARTCFRDLACPADDGRVYECDWARGCVESRAGDPYRWLPAEASPRGAAADEYVEVSFPGLFTAVACAASPEEGAAPVARACYADGEAADRLMACDGARGCVALGPAPLDPAPLDPAFRAGPDSPAAAVVAIATTPRAAEVRNCTEGYTGDVRECAAACPSVHPEDPRSLASRPWRSVDACPAGSEGAYACGEAGCERRSPRAHAIDSDPEATNRAPPPRWAPVPRPATVPRAVNGTGVYYAASWIEEAAGATVVRLGLSADVCFGRPFAERCEVGYAHRCGPGGACERVGEIVVDPARVSKPEDPGSPCIVEPPSGGGEPRREICRSACHVPLVSRFGVGFELRACPESRSTRFACGGSGCVAAEPLVEAPDGYAAPLWSMASVEAAAAGASGVGGPRSAPSCPVYADDGVSIEGRRTCPASTGLRFACDRSLGCRRVGPAASLSFAPLACSDEHGEAAFRDECGACGGRGRDVCGRCQTAASRFPDPDCARPYGTVVALADAPAGLARADLASALAEAAGLPATHVSVASWVPSGPRALAVVAISNATRDALASLAVLVREAEAGRLPAAASLVALNLDCAGRLADPLEPVPCAGPLAPTARGVRSALRAARPRSAAASASTSGASSLATASEDPAAADRRAADLVVSIALYVSVGYAALGVLTHLVVSWGYRSNQPARGGK